MNAVGRRWWPRAIAPALVLALFAGRGLAAGDPWVDRVREFTPGSSAGFGAQAMPAVVLGQPEGGGLVEGSTDVVSLGDGGSIVVVFRDNVVYDGEGDDLAIFENAFHSGSATGPIFAELAFVELSADGKAWTLVPYDASTRDGLAGREPVLADSSNGIDALGAQGGGDRFDIGDLGLAFVRYVRITDVGDMITDEGSMVPSGDKAGFDLDAVGAINSAVPGKVTGLVTVGGAAVVAARVRLRSEGLRTRTRRTRANGRFRFRRVLPVGDYTIKARKRGVGRARATLYIDPAQNRAALSLEFD